MTSNISSNLNLKNVPKELFNYINKHFSGAFVGDVIDEVDNDDNVFFKVDVSLEDTLYHLKFDSNGNLTHRDSEPLLELLDDEYTLVD